VKLWSQREQQQDQQGENEAIEKTAEQLMSEAGAVKEEEAKQGSAAFRSLIGET